MFDGSKPAETKFCKEYFASFCPAQILFRLDSGSIRSSPRYSVLIGETFWEPILRLCTSPIGGLDCFNVALALALALHEANCGAGHRSRNPYHHCLVCAVVSACLHLSICLGGSEIFRQRTLVFWFDTRFFFPLLPFFEPMEGKKKSNFIFFAAGLACSSMPILFPVSLNDTLFGCT